MKIVYATMVLSLIIGISGICMSQTDCSLLHFCCSNCGTEWQKPLSSWDNGTYNGFADSCPKCGNIEFGKSFGYSKLIYSNLYLALDDEGESMATVLYLILGLILVNIGFFVVGFNTCRLKILNRIEVKDTFTRREVLYIVTGKDKPNDH